MKHITNVLKYSFVALISGVFHFFLFAYITGSVIQCAISLGCSGTRSMSQQDVSVLLFTILFYSLVILLGRKILKLNTVHVAITVILVPFFYVVFNVIAYGTIQVLNQSNTYVKLKNTRQYLTSMKVGTAQSHIGDTQTDIRFDVILPIELMQNTDGFTPFYRLFMSPTIAEMGSHDNLKGCYGLLDGWADKSLYSHFPDAPYPHNDAYGATEIIPKGRYDMVFTYRFSKEGCSVETLSHVRNSLKLFRKINISEL